MLNCSTLILKLPNGIISKDNTTNKEEISMIYELKHYDLSLVRFSATEDTNTPEINILWINDENKELLPLDLELSAEGLSKC